MHRITTIEKAGVVVEGSKAGNFVRLAFRLVAGLVLLFGVISLVQLSLDNRSITVELRQLEAELGQMTLGDVDRVHIVEIENPDVPPEVMEHIARIWQFRCYFPSGYDYLNSRGAGRVTVQGVYQSGGSSSGWGMPSQEPIHELMTFSLEKRGGQVIVFSSIGGSSSTSSWHEVDPDALQSLVVQKLVHSETGARSFDQETILPLVKVYDPSTARKEEISGKSDTTYSGGQVVICPRSREAEFTQLRRGKVPADFDSSWLAGEIMDE